jgi:hypothetical protein
MIKLILKFLGQIYSADKTTIQKWGQNLIYYIDIIILSLVISFLIYDFVGIVFSLLDRLSGSVSTLDIICNVQGNTESTSTTTNHIIHNNKDGVRSVFIYGTGALRLHLSRGQPTSPLNRRAFIISSTLVAEGISRILLHAINDNCYVRFQAENSLTMWQNKKEGVVELHVEKDKETLKKKLDEVLSKNASSDSNSPDLNNFISDGNGLEELPNKILNYIIEMLGPILQPVQVNYSNEVLANQIYGISVLLFILSILIIILFIGFILNIFIFINSDKIKNYFTNKYIRMYVSYNKKLIALEIIFLSASILYFMYILTYGIYFIATHPIF